MGKSTGALFLFLSLFNLSFGSAKENGFAGELFTEKDYLRAVGEYKRLCFFAENSDSSDYYYFLIGECYRKMGDFEDAKTVYDNLLFRGSIKPALEKRLLIASSKCSINQGEVKYARIILNQLESYNESADTLHYLLGISYLKEKKFNEAKEEFNKITSSSVKENGSQKLKEISSYHFKSPTTALILSTFIPGAGQVYTSRPVKGIISFSLNFSLGYLTYRAVKDDRKMDAFLIAYFGLQRFYFGNLHQSKKYALHHNAKIVNSIQVE